MKRWILIAMGAALATFQTSFADRISEKDKTAVLNAVIEHLEQDYVDPEVGAEAAAALRTGIGPRDVIDDMNGAEYAQLLSQRLQELTGDGHLNVEHSDVSISDGDSEENSFSASEIERYYGAHINFGVQSVSRTEDNIGILDLRVFAPVDMAGDTVTAALNTIAHTDALIIDLRKNGGGMGDMADLIASYLFGPERQPLTGVYDRPSNTLTQRFTQPYVPGTRFGPDKPVYVLISSRTFSAAEALAYNLQALDRAVIVGEPSGGGAHPFEYLPIDDHFVLWSVTAKSIHPLTGSNWQGIGVQPDILADSDTALSAALSHFKGSQNSE